MTRADARCPVGRKLAFLSRPAAYPAGTGGVQVVETHMSWVFLTDERAYKLKKPVRLRHDSLDLRELEQRRRNCDEELRLNRRLAPDVYLAVVPLTLEGAGALALEGAGAVVDWLVVMRRLPAEHMLDRAIADGRVDEEALRLAVRALARMYRDGGPAPMEQGAYRDGLARGVESDRAALVEPGRGVPRDVVERLAEAQHALLRERPELFDARVAEGRIVEGHGDLRAEHVCLAPVAIIDCLEFDRGLRTLDTADELAFLALECERLGAPRLGAFVLDVYRAETGDAPPPELLRFYRRYRAMRRAKIAAWHLDDAGVRDPERWIARSRRYLGLAEPAAGASALEQLDERSPAV